MIAFNTIQNGFCQKPKNSEKTDSKKGVRFVFPRTLDISSSFGYVGFGMSCVCVQPTVKMYVRFLWKQGGFTMDA